MEDNRKARECKVQRCYECSRLQDELWDMAYEQVWPLVRRALAQCHLLWLLWWGLLVFFGGLLLHEFC